MAEAKEGKSAKYSGVYWRNVKKLDGLGTERRYYIIYRRGGRGSKKIEEPLGRASEGWTEAKANLERAARIAGKSSNVEMRKNDAAEKEEQCVPPTFDRLWEYYKEDHAHNPSIRDMSYRYHGHIQPYIGSKTYNEIVTDDIKLIRRKMESKGLASQSVKHGLALIRTVINYAHKHGYITLPQHLVFDMPKVDNVKTENMTEEQLRAYFKALDDEPDQDAASFLRLALLTGMRRGALMALKWDDIDFANSNIMLRGESAKSGRTDYIPLSQAAKNVLNTLPRNSEYVFPGQNGGQRKEYRRIAQRVRNKAGLPKDFRPLHGLRHCFASWLASSGEVDLYKLQKLLTHSSPQMTQRYAHLHDEALKRGAELAGSIFGGMDKEASEYKDSGPESRATSGV